MKATKNLSDEFIIGSGGSGRIYKAELDSGETVAVKRILWKDDCLLNKSFVSEVKTLGGIKHRHLVKLMGYVTNRGAGSNLLIYEYMENGSVWDWLHKQPANTKMKNILDWRARLKIAVGLAQGVEYLHHDCEPMIIHRDIKTSNILLDADMEAHLGDFGLAMAISERCDSSMESNSRFAWSYGYIAPGITKISSVTYTPAHQYSATSLLHYALKNLVCFAEFVYMSKATEKSDVYSMGIVLMELVTGKKPTDATFNVDMDMVMWVEKHMEKQGSVREQLIDPALKPLLPGEEHEAYQVLQIAQQCTKFTPHERPSSRQACNDLLHLLKDSSTPEFGKANMDSYP